MKRTARLFAIAEHLRARKTGITAAQLADRFGVTERTIYRDLDAMRDADFPLHADRGRGGGYALDRAYSLPPVNFNAREAALLVAACGWVSDMRVLPFTETLKSALDKVRSALSMSAQRELDEKLRGLKFIGVPARQSLPAVRRALERAWFEHRPMRIRYRGADGIVTTRKVRVTQVVMERAETLINCDDLDKGEARQFKLDRIEAAEVLRE